MPSNSNVKLKSGSIFGLCLGLLIGACGVKEPPKEKKEINVAVAPTPPLQKPVLQPQCGEIQTPILKFLYATRLNENGQFFVDRMTLDSGISLESGGEVKEIKMDRSKTSDPNYAPGIMVVSSEIDSERDFDIQLDLKAGGASPSFSRGVRLETGESGVFFPLSANQIPTLGGEKKSHHYQMEIRSLRKKSDSGSGQQLTCYFDYLAVLENGFDPISLRFSKLGRQTPDLERLRFFSPELLTESLQVFNVEIENPNGHSLLLGLNQSRDANSLFWKAMFFYHYASNGNSHFDPYFMKAAVRLDKLFLEKIENGKWVRQEIPFTFYPDEGPNLPINKQELIEIPALNKIRLIGLAAPQPGTEKCFLPEFVDNKSRIDRGIILEGEMRLDIFTFLSKENGKDFQKIGEAKTRHRFSNAYGASIVDATPLAYPCQGIF